MKIIGTAAAVVLVGLIGAGCSASPETSKTVAVDEPTTTTVEAPTTTTTVMLVTSTTTCRLVIPAGQLESDQATLDSLISGRREAESAVAQIQLIVDNAGRSIESYQRTLAGAQTTYNLAAEAAVLGGDTAQKKKQAAADNLADWKGIVASWEATRTKALGDLARGKATLADWDKQISQSRQAVATDRAAQTTLTCS